MSVTSASGGSVAGGAAAQGRRGNGAGAAQSSPPKAAPAKAGEASADAAPPGGAQAAQDSAQGQAKGQPAGHPPSQSPGQPASPAPGGKDRPTTNPRSAILGDCVALLLQSPGHRHLFLADLEWQLLPPLGLGQFRVWRKDLMPVITASWAFVSPEVDARLSKGQVKLGPQDWKSGEILWLMDIICPGACPGPRPGGGLAEAVKELKSQVFQGRPVKTLQPAPDGSMGVVTW